MEQMLSLTFRTRPPRPPLGSGSYILGWAGPWCPLWFHRLEKASVSGTSCNFPQQTTIFPQEIIAALLHFQPHPCGCAVWPGAHCTESCGCQWECPYQLHVPFVNLK